jgi:hypothetical protein
MTNPLERSPGCAGEAVKFDRSGNVLFVGSQMQGRITTLRRAPAHALETSTVLPPRVLWSGCRQPTLRGLQPKSLRLCRRMVTPQVGQLSFAAGTMRPQLEQTTRKYGW